MSFVTPRTLESEQEVRSSLVPVIVGAGIFGYTCVRSFHAAYGLRSVVVSGVDVRAVSSSRFCDYRVFEGYSDEARLLDYLCELGRELAASGRIGLLLGNADWHARLIASNAELLGQWYCVPYPSIDVMRRVTDKRSFYDICEELSIPYPRTLTVGCAEGSPDVDADALDYPVVAKPATSSLYDMVSFPGKEKVYEVYDAARLREVVALLRASDYDGDLIVQDFVPGPDDAMRSLTIFAADGEARAVSGGRVMIQDRDPLFIGNPDCIMIERVDEVVECGRRFCRHVGYDGFANFDVKYDERDGSYRFFEVNARAGRNTFYMTLAGIDYVRPLVESCVLGRDLPYAEAFEPHVYSVLPRAAVRRCDRLAPEDRERVLELFRQGRAAHPYDYAPDSLGHKFWTLVAKVHKVLR